MALKFLLDENISYVVGEQVRHHCPTLFITSVHTWRDGAFRGIPDKTLLLAARNDELTLVTYDLKTIPEALAELYAESEHHAGVVFIDDRTIANNDWGALTRALIHLWEGRQTLVWQDRVVFLDAPVS